MRLQLSIEEKKHLGTKFIKDATNKTCVGYVGSREVKGVKIDYFYCLTKYGSEDSKHKVAVRFDQAYNQVGLWIEGQMFVSRSITEYMDKIMVYVKVADDISSWTNTPGKVMRFIYRQDALEFGRQLSEYTSREVRLDFDDMTGECRGNGHYFYNGQCK